MVHSMRSAGSKFYHNCILSLTLAVVIISTGESMELFQVRFIESNGSRLIATSNYNYAISSPRLTSKNWRTVSVNGDSILAITVTGERVSTTRAALGQADLQFIEALRDEIANSTGGYRHMTTAGGIGGTNFMMSSSEGIGSSSSSSTSSSFSSSGLGDNAAGSSGQQGTRSGDMSYSMKDTNNYSVSRSDLPFNWSRIFINDDLVTFIFKNGDVQMMPISSLDANQLAAVNNLKAQVTEMQRTQSQQFANTMQNSMDMVSNVFNNIMGQFPRPPDYQSSVGNMFGNNFPFGPNNSPFSASSGWPFAGGVAGAGGAGAGAMAYATRR